ncbi:hypothetical protein MTO96_017825 [Rhipicephalus appendiculatus]
MHYCSESVPVRYYKKTVPARYRCGTVGHRPDACPNRTIGGAFTAVPRCKSLWTAERSTNVNPSALHAAETKCVGNYRKAWKPAPSQPQHGRKQRASNTSQDWREGAAQAKQPQPSNVPAGQKSKPPRREIPDLSGRAFPVTGKSAQTGEQGSPLSVPPPPILKF